MATELANYILGEYDENGDFVTRPMTSDEIADLIANAQLTPVTDKEKMQ